MNQTPQQPTATPRFYRVIAVVFFILGGVFVWAAVAQHSWFYGFFGIITVMNALMCLLKASALSATGTTK